MENQDIDQLADLAERVSRLERASRTSAAPGVASFPFDLGEDADANVVTYTGHGNRQGDPVAWEVKRTWEDVLTAVGDGLTGDPVASALSALASGPRLRIVAELAFGPVSTGDLAERMGQSGSGTGSAGQLFHHLKELLSVGIVHQPQRGVYAIRPAHVVPVLAILTAAMDLAPHVNAGVSPIEQDLA
jgi:DNA-binding transcriptional ArsR family regulator